MFDTEEGEYYATIRNCKALSIGYTGSASERNSAGVRIKIEQGKMSKFLENANMLQWNYQSKGGTYDACTTRQTI